MISWKQALDAGKDKLNAHCIPDADFDAYQLLLTFFDGDTASYMLHSAEEISSEQEDSYNRFLDRRINGEPLQYIIGKWDFYKSSFFVGEGVLIPRPETEELVDRCVELIKKNNYSVVYDLCTGSGSIGLSIAKECPQVTCYLFELYDKALYYAEKNLDMFQLENVKLIKHDILKKYNSDIQSADIIVSNPPYIESSEINSLQREVLCEPLTALDGGEDGLIFYRAIYNNWSDNLNCGGYFAFECGETQTDDIIAIAGDRYFSEAYKDIYSNYRFVVSKKL